MRLKQDADPGRDMLDVVSRPLLMTDEEFEEYDRTETIKNCPYYVEQEDDYTYIEHLLNR